LLWAGWEQRLQRYGGRRDSTQRGRGVRGRRGVLLWAGQGISHRGAEDGVRFCYGRGDADDGGVHTETQRGQRSAWGFVTAGARDFTQRGRGRREVWLWAGWGERLTKTDNGGIHTEGQRTEGGFVMGGEGREAHKDRRREDPHRDAEDGGRFCYGRGGISHGGAESQPAAGRFVTVNDMGAAPGREDRS
jgi:hypothetical protein